MLKRRDGSGGSRPGALGWDVFRKERQETLVQLLQARPATCIVLQRNSKAMMSQSHLLRVLCLHSGPLLIQTKHTSRRGQC